MKNWRVVGGRWYLCRWLRCYCCHDCDISISSSRVSSQLDRDLFDRGVKEFVLSKAPRSLSAPPYWRTESNPHLQPNPLHSTAHFLYQNCNNFFTFLVVCQLVQEAVVAGGCSRSDSIECGGVLFVVTFKTGTVAHSFLCVFSWLFFDSAENTVETATRICFNV